MEIKFGNGTELAIDGLGIYMVDPLRFKEPVYVVTDRLTPEQLQDADRALRKIETICEEFKRSHGLDLEATFRRLCAD